MMSADYMTIPIEDTIIAYFDGRLNDTDGAELLHRVSVSPEIRQIFQEHETLRQVAFRAARNVSVPPALEESLFQRIAVIENEESLPLAYWSTRRISAFAGVAALLLAVAVGSFELGNSSVENVNHNSLPIVTGTNVHSNDLANAIPATNSVGAQGIRNVHKLESGFSGTSGTNTTNTLPSSESVFEPAMAASEHAIELLPASRSVEVARITLPSTGHTTIESLRDIAVVDQASNFEIGLASPFSGFGLPATMPQASIFSDVSLRFAYNFDTEDQIAFKLTRGSFAGLSTISTKEPGFTDINGQLQLQQESYAGELFYQRRETIEHGLFFVTGGVGGGFYSQGSLLSAEIGLEVPIGERFLGGVSLVVSRFHQNGSEQSLLTGNEPVIYDGSNAFNTVAGSIEYGLSYRF
jgi:hypothetical protein